MNNAEFHGKLNGIREVMYAFAYNLTKNAEDAKDLLQEASYRALNNQDKFQPDSNLKAWVFTIIKNLFINNYRRRQKSNTILDNTENQFLLNSAAHSSGNRAEGTIMLEELNGMVSGLDDSIRVPFVMHFEGFKYQEIAEDLDLPLGTVKSRIFFARKALKDQILGRYGFEPTV